MKIVKMAAIATMALTLFASCNKNDEPAKQVSSFTLRINDAELRALEAQVADKTKADFSEIKVIIIDGQKVVKLAQQADIDKAKSADGYTIPVKSAVTKVQVIANGELGTKSITEYQALGTEFAKSIPMTATVEGAAITSTTDPANPKNITYTATLTPIPQMARLEVFGEIKGSGFDASGKKNKFPNPFKKITVEEIWVNNYLMTSEAGSRYYTPSNGTAWDETTNAIKPEMHDVIDATKDADFRAKNICAAYQLFPATAAEKALTDLPAQYFDHLVLKVKLEWDLSVAKNVAVETEEGYVTIQRFMMRTTGDLDKGFEAGKIYKLDLGQLNKDFKDGDTPVTPDPEHEGDLKLVVKVEPYEWTAVNIKPDTNNGYKK